jgi:hypothetical protein
MVTVITGYAGEFRMSPGESMTFDARIRYWEEEWISQLLEEALRLKGTVNSCGESSSSPST